MFEKKNFMPEIKFRVWEQKQKVMLYDGFALSPNGTVSFYWNKLPIHSAFTILMRLTGLRDRNRKDIWEGDYMDTEEGLMEVFWIDGRFILMWADTGTHRCELYEANSTLEVCGNKYEGQSVTV